MSPTHLPIPESCKNRPEKVIDTHQMSGFLRHVEPQHGLLGSGSVHWVILDIPVFKS